MNKKNLHSVVISLVGTISVSGDSSSVQTYYKGWPAAKKILNDYIDDLAEEIYLYDFSGIDKSHALEFSVYGPMPKAEAPRGMIKGVFGNLTPMDYSKKFGGARSLDIVSVEDYFNFFLKVPGAQGARLSKAEIESGIASENII